MQLKRITVYPKDVELLTGRSDRYARKVIRQIRVHAGKQKHHLVTITELCEYLNIRQEEAIKQLDLRA